MNDAGITGYEFLALSQEAQRNVGLRPRPRIIFREIAKLPGIAEGYGFTHPQFALMLSSRPSPIELTLQARRDLLERMRIDRFIIRGGRVRRPVFYVTGRPPSFHDKNMLVRALRSSAASDELWRRGNAPETSLATLLGFTPTPEDYVDTSPGTREKYEVKWILGRDLFGDISATKKCRVRMDAYQQSLDACPDGPTPKDYAIAIAGAAIDVDDMTPNEKDMLQGRL